MRSEEALDVVLGALEVAGNSELGGASLAGRGLGAQMWLALGDDGAGNGTDQLHSVVDGRDDAAGIREGVWSSVR